MSGPAVVFREIHRLRHFLHELEEQIDRVPRQQKAQLAKVTRQEEALRSAQDAVKQLKVEVHGKEVNLRTSHGQIAKFQKQLNDVTSKKEYDALRHEIRDAETACRQIEDEILDRLGQSEEKTASLPELEKAVEQAKQEYASFQSNAQERLANFHAQLTQARQQLQEQEKLIPATHQGQYQRVVAARGHDAMSGVQGRSCAACCTEITAQQHNELQQELFVSCKSCGRILHLTE